MFRVTRGFVLGGRFEGRWRKEGGTVPAVEGHRKRGLGELREKERKGEYRGRENKDWRRLVMLW